MLAKLTSSNGKVSFNVVEPSVSEKIALLRLIETATDKAISVDFDRSMILGRMYHELADEIKAESGVDPRPYAEVFWSTQS